MFRAPKYLEKAEFTKVNLDTPITLPGNGQAQTKTGYKFFLRDRDIVYDWFNTYFHVEFQSQATANGGLVAADTQTAPINSSFSLIKSLTIRSAGKTFYEANNVHKVIFIKNLVEYSEDYARTVAKDEFWYLDGDDTNITGAAATNNGIRACALLSQGNPIKTIKTIIPLNRYSSFEELSYRLLPPMQLSVEITLQEDAELIFQNADVDPCRIFVTKLELWVPRLQLTAAGKEMVNAPFFKPTKWRYLKEILIPTGARADASGQVQISAGIVDVKHVFVFLQKSEKENPITQNPYLFDTFSLDGGARLSTCRLQYGETFIPEWTMKAKTNFAFDGT